MKQFEVGKTYSTRSVCDHNCVFSYTVLKRTAKFITIKNKWGETKRVGAKPSYCGEHEVAYPEGSYSMCPVLYAKEAH